VRRQLRAKAERNAETQSYLVEVMTGIQTVKAQNIELRSRWQWQERYARYVAEGFQTVMTSTLAGSFSHFFNQLSGLLVLWVGAALVLDAKTHPWSINRLPDYLFLRYLADSAFDPTLAKLPRNRLIPGKIRRYCRYSPRSGTRLPKHPHALN
jgi:ABC-type multidrug transport system fused ATPase/permease subunit